MLIVSAGKWVYEVLISSQGLMQIGWCTLNCHFNQEVHTLTHKQTNNAHRGTGKHQRTQTDTHTRAHENTHSGPHAHAHTNTRRHTHTQTHRGTHKHTEAQTNHTILHHDCCNTLQLLLSICATTDQVHGSITASLMQSL